MIARGGLGVLVLVVLWLGPQLALAHGIHPGVLRLVEQQPGRFDLTFVEPVDTRGDATAVDIEFPAHCRAEGDQLDCGLAGLRGTLALRAEATNPVRVLALVQWLDGRSVEAMLGTDAPALGLEPAPGRSAWAWTSLGIEHILGGLDHLAFVLGLLLVVGTRHLRRLLATITAFTLAHSITLALAVTGTLTLAAAPVEATIAASVVLVAREATHDWPTLTRRAPWAVALGFGLIHGLGFAGALASWGLPEGWVGRSLLWFNVGVELGQLWVILALVLGVRVLGRWLGDRLEQLRPLVAYATGGLGAWWLVERTLAVVRAGS